MPGLKLNLTSNPSLNLSGLSKGDMQRIVAAVEAALQDDFDLINQNIDTHTTDTDIHVMADERTLWNTVSDKAEQSDVKELQEQADNNSLDITSLQTQMGDIETALDDKADKAELEELQATIGEINTLLEKRLDGET